MPKPQRYQQPAKRPGFLERYGRVGVVAAGVLLAVGFVAAGLFSSATTADYTCDSTLDQGAAPQATTVTTENLGSTHVAVGTRISYGFCPPTSGSHFSQAGAGPIRPGVYPADASVGPGGWVHNLEHGYVVVAYRPDAPDAAATLAALRDFAAAVAPTETATSCGLPNKVVVVPFKDMVPPVALLAWDRYLPLAAWDPSQGEEFVSRWMERTAPEPAAC